LTATLFRTIGLSTLLPEEQVCDQTEVRCVPKFLLT